MFLIVMRQPAGHHGDEQRSNPTFVFLHRLKFKVKVPITYQLREKRKVYSLKRTQMTLTRLRTWMYTHTHTQWTCGRMQMPFTEAPRKEKKRDQSQKMSL